MISWVVRFDAWKGLVRMVELFISRVVAFWKVRWVEFGYVRVASAGNVMVCCAEVVIGVDSKCNVVGVVK